jgi:hypothetical protein
MLTTHFPALGWTERRRPPVDLTACLATAPQSRGRYETATAVGPGAFAMLSTTAVASTARMIIIAPVASGIHANTFRGGHHLLNLYRSAI